MLTHHGTCFDASVHMIPNGKTLDSYDSSTIIQPAVILNLAPHVEPGSEITSKVLSRFNDVIKGHGVVLLYTGWSGRRGGMMIIPMSDRTWM